ncbi:MAG: hypothetical protein IKU53_00730 [Firmicutes bacterium]|nr:hypothetical protein [Bacillota bacterium]
MKRFEYFKLNFNMAKNETMIAMMLAFIAPIIASLGERESIRSFLMGTDGPSMLQMVAGLIIFAIAIAVLVKAIIKISYDSFVSESAQIYATLPISLSDAALIKITVLSLNMLIVLLGLVVGTVVAWLFGNNDAINSLFDVIVSLVTSGKIEYVAIIPTSIIATVVFAFFINGIIFSAYCGYVSSYRKPKGSSGKGMTFIKVIIYAAIFIGIMFRPNTELLIYMANNDYIDVLWLGLLGVAGVYGVVGAIIFGICVFKLNEEYYM